MGRRAIFFFCGLKIGTPRASQKTSEHSFVLVEGYVSFRVFYWIFSLFFILLPLLSV